MHTHIYTHLYIHTDLSACTHTYTRIRNTQTRSYRYMHMQTSHTHTQTQVHAHARLYTRTHTHTTLTRTPTHSRLPPLRPNTGPSHPTSPETHAHHPRAGWGRSGLPGSRRAAEVPLSPASRTPPALTRSSSAATGTVQAAHGPGQHHFRSRHAATGSARSLLWTHREVEGEEEGGARRFFDRGFEPRSRQVAFPARICGQRAVRPARRPLGELLLCGTPRIGCLKPSIASRGLSSSGACLGTPFLQPCCQARAARAGPTWCCQCVPLCLSWVVIQCFLISEGHG